MGFEQAGFDVVAAVEYDPVHAATHAFNFPHGETLCRDISRLSGRDIVEAAERGFRRMHPKRPWAGQIDAIIGGPPCQGFSTGGKRESGDERNNLLLEFVRIVEEVKPRVVCLENVAGLLEGRFDDVRNVALQRLQAAGYSMSGTERAINSLDYGVPQSRRRVVVLGALGAEAPSMPAPQAGVVTVAQAFEGLPSPSAYDGLLNSDSVRLQDQDLARRAATVNRYARALAGEIRSPGDVSWPRIWDPSEHTGGRRTVHTGDTIRRFASTAQGTVEPKSRLYRLPLDGPARTLRAGTGSERGAHTSPRPIHPIEDRVITVREAARLHGYPDWFRFHTTNWHGHRQVGNSVPPPLARAAASALLVALECSPKTVRRRVAFGDVSLLALSRTSALSVLNVVEDHLPKTRSRSTGRDRTRDSAPDFVPRRLSPGSVAPFSNSKRSLDDVGHL
ncbi:DNA cytosine methyltransferase [Cellulomonas sp. IC4_254]|nr:DNA cytosine methyltransferase [Cellulomonas sp. IC4_254]